MNNDQKGQRDLTDDVKIMPDDVNFVKPGKANPKIIDKANPKIIDPTSKETYPSEIHALKIDANHIKIDGHEYLVVRDKLITTDRREIADKLYEWAGRMECAANAAMTAPDKINDDLLVKYRKLIALLDEHEMLDKL
jgi:FAD/FMN-containing dehydrogenase